MIRIIPSFLALIAALLLLAGLSSAQTALSGRVTAVIDGKTFVIETVNGRVTGTIQYIDVTEPEQPLSRIVREHFQRLVVGKTVTFVPNGFSPAALVGKLYLDGLDMGQQLVRDGAAWHVPPDRSGQKTDETRIYEGHQTMAKVEKRGIWSIANMTPAWEFRSLKDRSFQDTDFIQTAIRGAGSEDARNYKQAKNDPDMWTEVGGEAFAQRNPVGQMFWGYDADKKIRNTSTPSIAQLLTKGKKPLEVEIRVIYFQGELKPRTPNTAFVFGVLATSREHNFAKDSFLRFSADGTDIEVSTGQGFYKENLLSVQELIQYRISRSDLLKMANAKKLTISVGGFSGTVGSDLRQAISQLIETVK